MPVGLFFVTFSQAYVLAQKSSSTYSKAEKLTDELKEYANNLEKIVGKRTRKIQLQKEKIETQKKNIEKAAAELQKSNENLIKLAEYKKNMTSMMVHDLKNPLNTIIGFTTFEDSINEYKEHIHSSGWKMLNLVQNILDVEQFETSKPRLNKKYIDLKGIVDLAYNNLQYIISRNGMVFYNEVPENIKVMADEDMLVRVISNILSNAAKYAGRNKLIRIFNEKIYSSDGAEYIKLNIYNNGNPIPEDKLEEIFQKYNRLSDSELSEYHSSGIGLAFCKMAINAHGGEIFAVSGIENGVTFWFTLPAIK
jgi:signal transduction histidine kinase